ncbi:MAG: hypothetical protein OEV42_04915 [Deltaproteobacteria bacterium]|nr:hypothetical protein [Deltaproteobacteria bacterium]
MFEKIILIHNRSLLFLYLLIIGISVAFSSFSLFAMGGMSIFDGVPTEEACRDCHEDLINFPMLERSNPDKHHLLVGTPIPLPEDSTAPNAPGGFPGEDYECMSCHEMDFIPETQTYGLAPFRDCLLCHPEWVVTGSPMMGTNIHHETQTFLLGDCQACHGSGMDDGGMGGGGMGGGGMGGM